MCYRVNLRADCVIIGWYSSSSWIPVCWTSLLIFSCDLCSFGTIVCLLCSFLSLSLSVCAQTCWTEHRRNVNYPRLMGFLIVKASWRWVFLESRTCWEKLLDLKLVKNHSFTAATVSWWLLICWTLFINHFHPESRKGKLKALCGTFPLQTLAARYWFVLRHSWKL